MLIFPYILLQNCFFFFLALECLFPYTFSTFFLVEFVFFILEVLLSLYSLILSHYISNLLS